MECKEKEFSVAESKGFMNSSEGCRLRSSKQTASFCMKERFRLQASVVNESFTDVVFTCTYNGIVADSDSCRLHYPLHPTTAAVLATNGIETPSLTDVFCIFS